MRINRKGGHAGPVRLPSQPFYVLDPSVGNDFGGYRVREDEKKGRHVLAPKVAMQYWIDQGLVSEKPLSELSDAHKKLLSQLTRGRSEDKDPGRIPRYDRLMQSGSPEFALSTPRRRKAKKRTTQKVEKKTPAPPATPPASPPPKPAP